MVDYQKLEERSEEVKNERKKEYVCLLLYSY